MKLITEISEEFEIKEEIIDEATGKKKLFIEGIFMQGGQKNRNGRIYPTEMLAEKVEAYNKSYVDRNRAFGELGHPQGPTVNGDRICMRVTELRQDGNNFLGKAQISSTPMGQIVEGLIKDGGQLGVSSRGMGTLKMKNGINEVQRDYIISAIDVVTDPSAPDAFVDGIMEGVDWIQDEKGLWVQQIDEIKKEIRRASRSELQEAKVRAFAKFLKQL